MSKALVVFFSTIFTLFLGVNVSQAAQFGIITGNISGTYYEIGKDLSQLLKRDDIDLGVHTSQGSLENIISVYFNLPQAQIGIVQSDVLAYISTKKDKRFSKIAPKIRLLYPLYNEEVHILASKNVTSFSDLADKRVAIGEKNSGTFITANTLLKIAGIKIIPVEIGGDNALQGLKKGKIDAMFYVAGFPFSLFKEKVTKNDNLHLLPVQNKQISAIYNTFSTIPANAYPWLEKDTPTVAVKAVLITYDYKGANCTRIGRITEIIESNLDWLRDNGHSKWQEVDLGFKLAGWAQYECIRGEHVTNKMSEFEALLKAISEQ